jgi:hypothetical protein
VVLPQVWHVTAAWSAQDWSHTTLQQPGSILQTALQQSASEQLGPVCDVKQLRKLPSWFVSPHPVTLAVQDGLRTNGESLVGVTAVGPFVRLPALRHR